MSIRNLIESAIKGDALSFNEEFSGIMNEAAVVAVEDFKDPETDLGEVADVLIGLGVLTIEELEAEMTEEELLELSKKTLGSYVKNAKASIVGASIGIGMNAGVHSGKVSDESKKMGKTFTKRNNGIDKAVNKLTKEETEVVKETQLDELSSHVLGSYVRKSSKQAVRAATMTNRGENKDMVKIMNKRLTGVSRAADRIQDKKD